MRCHLSPPLFGTESPILEVSYQKHRDDLVRKAKMPESSIKAAEIYTKMTECLRLILKRSVALFIRVITRPYFCFIMNDLSIARILCTLRLRV